MHRILLSIFFFFSVSCVTGKRQFLTKPVSANSNQSLGFSKIEGVFLGQSGIETTKGRYYRRLALILYKNGTALYANLGAGPPDKDTIGFSTKDSVNLREYFSGSGPVPFDPEPGGYKVLDNKIQIQVFSHIGPFWELTNFSGSMIDYQTIVIEACMLKSRPKYCIDNTIFKRAQIPMPDPRHQFYKKRWFWN